MKYPLPKPLAVPGALLNTVTTLPYAFTTTVFPPNV